MVEALGLMSIIGPIVSVGGALASWYWAQKRFRWDAGKELGALRAETIGVLHSAVLVTNPTWRRLPFRFYRDARDEWERSLARSEPLIGNKALVDLQRLRRGFDYFEGQFLRSHVAGLEFAQARAGDDHDRFHVEYDDPTIEPDDVMPKQDEVDFLAYLKRLGDDPHFLTR